MKREKKKLTKHALVEEATIFGIRSPFGAVGLIVMAQRFLGAAKIVREGRPEDERWSPVEHFLACRTIELGLKAFLSLKGKKLQELSGGPYGHDLQNLLAEADTNDMADLIPLTEIERFNIERAHRYYLEKVFEYPAVIEALKGYPEVANVDHLLTIGDRLVSQLMDPCSMQSAETATFVGRIEVSSVSVDPKPDA